MVGNLVAPQVPKDYLLESSASFGSPARVYQKSDISQLGPSLTGLALSLRCVGYGLVTPFVEELFIRGWLTRYAAIFDRGGDFRDVPIGHYTLRSLLIVTAFFHFTTGAVDFD